jgi:hypothetical protein
MVNPGPSVIQSNLQFCGVTPQAVKFKLKKPELTTTYYLKNLTSNAIEDSVVNSSDSLTLTSLVPTNSSSYQILAKNASSGCLIDLDSTFKVGVGNLPLALNGFILESCGGGIQQIPVSPGVGNSARWYRNENDLLPISNDSVLTTQYVNAFDTITFWVARVNALGCESQRAFVTVYGLRQGVKPVGFLNGAHTNIRFDKGSLLDFGTSGNNGVIGGTKKDSTDRFGIPNSAIYLDGNSRITTTKQINNPQNFSVGIWFKTTTTDKVRFTTTTTTTTTTSTDT